MLKKITTSFVTLIVALLVMLTSTIATPLSVKAETIAANTTSVKDVNEDGIVNVFDLVAMKKSLINDSPSQWSVLDLIQLQKFLLNVQDDNSHRVFDVTNMDVTDQNTWLLRNYFCSDFSKSYVDGFDGSICVYFADGLYEIKFDSSIVSYDSPKFNQAEHICQYYCEEKQETLYVTILMIVTNFSLNPTFPVKFTTLT